MAFEYHASLDYYAMSGIIGGVGSLGSGNVGLTILNQYAHAWWHANNINNWGQYPDPQGNYPKPDINFILPANTPLPAILPGTVSGINSPSGQIPSYGAVVTVKLDTPINDIATHYAYLHLTRVQDGLRVGQHVNIGDNLGYAGGNITAGSAPAAMGFALYPGDYYGFGSYWTQYIQTKNNVPDQRLNPTALINDITGGKTTDYLSNNGPASVGGNGLSGLIQKPVQPLLQPSDSVQQTLTHIDIAMQLINPVPQGSYSIQDIPTWIGDFFTNLGTDTMAFLFRSLIVAIGVYICFGVINTSLKGSLTGGFRLATKGITHTINATAPEMDIQ
jgi:hypothetical protein